MKKILLHMIAVIVGIGGMSFAALSYKQGSIAVVAAVFAGAFTVQNALLAAIASNKE